jgi:hypothetical protein
MKRLLALGLSLFLMGLVSTGVHAQMKIVRGEGRVASQGAANGPAAEDRAAAMKAAKLAAWRSYLAIPGQNETVDQIRANEQMFLSRLDELLVDVVTVDENFNREQNLYTVRIKATVSETLVGSMIRGLARGAGTGQASASGSGLGSSPILVLGMAREADVVKSFLDKQTKVSERSNDSESSQTKVGVAGRSSVSSETSSSTVRNKEVVGGNVERKRDKVTYKIGNVGILNSKLPRILLQNGIKASPYAFLMRTCRLPNPDNFSRQYAASEMGELPSNVMAEIQENLASCARVKFWVFASMDVGGYGVDPNTGMALATVSVNVQLFEVESGAQLASASKDVAGRSADQSDAIRVASDLAVQAVGDIITAQVANVGR